MGVIVDARDLFLAVRELVELSRETARLTKSKPADIIDARPLFMALRVGIPVATLQARLRRK